MAGWLQLMGGVLLSALFIPLLADTQFNQPLVYLALGFILAAPITFLWVWARYGWKAALTLNFVTAILHARWGDWPRRPGKPAPTSAPESSHSPPTPSPSGQMPPSDRAERR